MDRIDQSQFDESEDAPARLRRPPFKPEPTWHDEGFISFAFRKLSVGAFAVALLSGIGQLCDLTPPGYWWRIGTASILLVILSIVTDRVRGQE